MPRLRSGTLDSVKVVRGDICDRDLLDRTLGEYEINTVFHLAAQTIVGIANRNPISTFESNIADTWNVLDACRRSTVVKAIVLASSDKAYGDQPDLLYSEGTPLEGCHPYDVSKSCADLLAQASGQTYSLPVAITRCGNFYGGGDLNWNRIVPGTIRSVLRGDRPVIRSLADERLRGQAYNFSNEIQVPVLDLVNRILRQMHSPLTPDVRNKASNEIRHQYLSACRARTELGWSPLFTLDQGITQTISWYREFFA